MCGPNMELRSLPSCLFHVKGVSLPCMSKRKLENGMRDFASRNCPLLWKPTSGRDPRLLGSPRASTSSTCRSRTFASHEVKLMDFTKWLDRTGGSPREVSDRHRIRSIFGIPISDSSCHVVGFSNLFSLPVLNSGHSCGLQRRVCRKGLGCKRIAAGVKVGVGKVSPVTGEGFLEV